MISLINFFIIICSFPLVFVFEKKILKKRSIFFYPFIVMLFVIFLHLIYEVFYDYNDLNPKATLVIVFGFFLLSFSSIFFPHKVKFSYYAGRANFEKLLFLPIVMIIFSSMKLFYYFLTQNGSLELIELNNEEISNINNYVFYQILLTPIIFFSTFKKKIKFFLLGLNLLCLFLTFVKGTILISVISIFIYNIEILKIKIKIKYLLSILVGGLCIFSFSYLIPMYFLSNDLNPSFFIEKFAHYLFAGLDGFSVFTSVPVNQVYLPTEILFAPFINLLSNLTGLIDNIRVMDFASLNSLVINNNNEVNVFTLFGTIYIACGKNILLYSAIIIFFGIITNFFFAISTKLKLFYTSISSIIWLSCFYLSFFEFYFWHSFLYYIILFGLSLDFIFYFFKFFIYEKK